MLSHSEKQGLYTVATVFMYVYSMHRNMQKYSFIKILEV